MIHNEHVNDGGQNFIDSAAKQAKRNGATRCYFGDDRTPESKRDICRRCKQPIDLDKDVEYANAHHELGLSVGISWRNADDTRHSHSWQCVYALIGR